MDHEQVIEAINSLSIRGQWSQEMLDWIQPFKKNGESYVEMMSKGRKKDG